MVSSKQYGARYGIKPKRKADAVFKLRETSTKCPYCLKNAVKRLSTGIWNCKACGVKFTGGAYTFSRKHISFDVKEADFLVAKVKEKQSDDLEGFDEKQEVSF
jgi:large subunit ribosomal protein L37Ae